MTEEKLHYLTEAVYSIRSGFQMEDEDISVDEIVQGLYRGELINVSDVCQLVRDFQKTDDEFEQFLKTGGNDEYCKKEATKIADYLCGFSCGSAVDGIIEYLNRPDCSYTQASRLSEKLKEYLKGDDIPESIDEDLDE